MKGFGELNKALIKIKNDYNLSNSDIYKLLNKELEIIRYLITN